MQIGKSPKDLDELMLEILNKFFTPWYNKNMSIAILERVFPKELLKFPPFNFDL